MEVKTDMSHQDTKPEGHTPLSRDEVEAAEKLCEKATEGPWEWRDTTESWRIAVPPPKPLVGGGFDGPRYLDLVIQAADSHVDEPLQEDADLIAASRSLLPRALADVKKLMHLVAAFVALDDAAGREDTPGGYYLKEEARLLKRVREALAAWEGGGT